MVCIEKEYDQTAGSFCDEFIKEKGFGYGSNKNAFVLLIGTEKDFIYIKGYGAGEKIFTKAEKENLIASMRERREKGGDWLSCIYNCLSKVLPVLNENKEIRSEYADGNAVETPENKYLYQRYEWYPEDLKSFEDFHNERISRVIDDAHIFSKEEIEAMKEHIKKIQDENGFDLVVYTDTKTYGQRGLKAADFHHFNGYGFGDDFSGTVLFICMQENHRYWWTAATGKCQGIYTEKVINAIDDNLEPFMKDGKYGEGIIGYLDDVYDLYKTPDWYPKDVDSFVPFRAQNKTYCVDQIGIFTAEQKAEIEKQAAEISFRYGTDFVVLTMDKAYRAGNMASYARDFAKYKGYGAGENGDALILCIKVNGKGTWASLVSTLSQEDRACYKDKNLTNILGHIRPKLHSGQQYNAVIKALSYVEKLYTKGKVRHELHFIWPIWVSILLALVAAYYVYFYAYLDSSVDMKPIKDSKNPSRYYVDGSLILKNEKEKFVKSYTETEVFERERYSSHSSGSSSGSSGRSSYSSNYSSSGGRSYSGGGRSF